MNEIFKFNNILSIVYILNIIFIITIIFFERRKNNNTLTWVLILMFTNVIGFLCYIFFGLSLRKRRFTKKHFNRFSFNKDQIKKDVKSEPNNHFQASMVRLFNIKNHAFLRSNNEVKLYNHGQDFFDDFIEYLKNATNYIHLEFYIFYNDKLGNEIMDILIKKAQEGIEVILIYDGMGCLKVPKKFFNSLEKAGGIVLEFFPPLFSKFGIRANYRTHRKISLIDGKCGFLGGLNIGDEYLGRNPKRGYWRDTHLQIKGASVLELEKEFLINLDFVRDHTKKYKKRNKDKKFPIDKYLYFEESNGNVDLQIISSGPDYEEPYIKNGFFKMIVEAKKSIYIQTPYFIPDESTIKALEIAIMSGVEVNIMIPNKPDHMFVYWATLSYVGDLLKIGAKCYSYENGFLHSKVIMIDDKICSIGSTNMDIRSFYLNFEINAFIYDPKIALEIKEAFLEDVKKSTLITPKIYANRGKIIKFKESISRLLSPIM